MPGTVLRVITRLNRGGPLRQLCALVPGLREHGWSGPVLTGRVAQGEPDGSEDLRRAGADVVVVRALGRRLDPVQDARAFRALRAAIRELRPDLVHTHTAKAGALGRLAAACAGVPAAHTFHGHHLEAAPAKAALARFAERRLARFTTAAVALTGRQRRDLVEVHRVLPAGKVHVIGPGMDLVGFRARAAHPGPGGVAQDAPPGAVRFLWTGRFVGVKAPALLVEAVARCTQPLHVTMLGRGPLLEAVRVRVRRLGLERRVALPGSAADVAPWVAACDALVLCSRSEGAPLSVVEAMALGRPVVVTTVGGLPDLVAHGRTGLWVPPGDAGALARAMDRLAADAAERARLGAAAAREATERFGAARLARETAALYESLLAPRLSIRRRDR